LFARAVCEKLRVWTCRPDAASRRKPGENIVKSDRQNSTLCTEGKLTVLRRRGQGNGDSREVDDGSTLELQ
jgi:hypothetical protein